MKAYLLSCVFGHNISETENKDDSRFDEGYSTRQNERMKDDIDSGSCPVENVLNEFLEILVQICI